MDSSMEMKKGKEIEIKGIENFAMETPAKVMYRC
jgi:hypothetical protein